MQPRRTLGHANRAACPKSCRSFRGRDRIDSAARMDARVCQLRSGNHRCCVLVHLARTSPLDLISRRPNGTIGAARTLALAHLHLRRQLPLLSEFGALFISLGTIALLTALYFVWLGATNPAIV